MLENKPNNDDLDLSEMMDEYEEDSELRKKIEAMKQEQKEAPASSNDEQIQEQEDSALIQDTTASQDTMELPKSTQNSTFINVDDVEATRVIDPIQPETQEDGDKTLVIMNNEKQRVFHEEDAASKEQNSDSLYLYDDREIDEEEITEEDIKEFLGEEEGEAKKSSKDPKKTNKTMMYVLIGVIALALMVVVGFGVKMLIDNNNPDPKTEEPSKNSNSDKDKEKDKDKDKDKDADKSDSTKRIAEINALIKEYQAQIDDLNAKIDTAQNDIKQLDQNIANYDNSIPDLSAKCETASQPIESLKKNLQVAKDALAQNPEDQELQAKVDAAQKAYDDAVANQTEFCNAYDIAKTNKASEEAKKKDAENKKAEYQSAITDLQNKIQELQNERDSLSK